MWPAVVSRGPKLTHRLSFCNPQVTEEQVLHVFTGCGTIVDSRMCGDPNSALRFAFVEFDSEEAVGRARRVPYLLCSFGTLVER